MEVENLELLELLMEVENLELLELLMEVENLELLELPMDLEFLIDLEVLENLMENLMELVVVALETMEVAASDTVVASFAIQKYSVDTM